jgi:hypothetical protein
MGRIGTKSRSDIAAFAAISANVSLTILFASPLGRFRRFRRHFRHWESKTAVKAAAA